MSHYLCLMLVEHHNHHNLHPETTVGAENPHQGTHTTLMVCYSTTTLHETLLNNLGRHPGLAMADS